VFDAGMCSRCALRSYSVAPDASCIRIPQAARCTGDASTMESMEKLSASPSVGAGVNVEGREAHAVARKGMAHMNARFHCTEGLRDTGSAMNERIP
jgi:hypothetical protein